MAFGFPTPCPLFGLSFLFSFHHTIFIAIISFSFDLNIFIGIHFTTGSKIVIILSYFYSDLPYHFSICIKIIIFLAFFYLFVFTHFTSFSKIIFILETDTMGSSRQAVGILTGMCRILICRSRHFCVRYQIIRRSMIHLRISRTHTREETVF